MSNILFASDLHLSHKLAVMMRGFSSATDRREITQDEIDEHDNTVIDSIASKANKRTVTWILGDVCMNIYKLPLLNNIPGRKIMVRGNHDTFGIHEYIKYFEDIHGIVKYKNFWISHCPIHQQEMYRAYGNIHGHIHKNTNSPELQKPYFNVNWDFLRGPISLDEIKDIFGVKRGN